MQTQSFSDLCKRRRAPRSCILAAVFHARRRASSGGALPVPKPSRRQNDEHAFTRRKNALSPSDIAASMSCQRGPVW